MNRKAIDALQRICALLKDSKTAAGRSAYVLAWDTLRETENACEICENRPFVFELRGIRLCVPCHKESLARQNTTSTISQNNC